MKKNSLKILCLLFSAAAFAQQPKTKKEFTTNGKKITVYTTAENSKLRLTTTDNLTFSAAKQPLETETSVFVQPAKKFQTFMGIFQFLTDAFQIIQMLHIKLFAVGVIDEL